MLGLLFLAKTNTIEVVFFVFFLAFAIKDCFFDQKREVSCCSFVKFS